MRRRTIVALAAGALTLAGAGGTAAVAAPGPNGHNTYGLCKAYFSGSDQGRAQKRKAPPFVALERAAEEADQSVEQYCAANGQKPGGGPR